MEQHSAVKDYDHTEEPHSPQRNERQEIMLEKDDSQEVITFRPKESRKEDNQNLGIEISPQPKDAIITASVSHKSLKKSEDLEANHTPLA